MVTTSYYSRNWENIALLPSLENDQWIKYGKQTTELVLPFISLYKPAALPISYGLGLWNITQKSGSIYLGSPNKCQDAAEIAKTVAELASTYFQLRAGLIVNTTLELLQHFYRLYQAPPEERIERLGSCISTSLYLLSLVQPHSLQWTIASLIFHACLSFYQTYQAGKEVYQAGTYRHEKTPTVIAKGLMGIIRLYQAHQAYQSLKSIQALERLIKRTQEMDEEETDLLFEETPDLPTDDTHASTNPSQDSVPQEVAQHPSKEETDLFFKEGDAPDLPTDDTHASSNPSQDSIPQEVAQLPSEEEILLKDHPLKNLVQQIEAKRVVLINPTSGEKQDFGAYFHGYGKGLVKGANLRFQHIVTKEGSHVTQLHFKINELYKERVLKHLDVLHKLSPEQAGQFATSLKGKNFRVESPQIWEKNSVQHYLSLPQPEIFHVEDVGSLCMMPGMCDLVEVSLQGDQDIESFHKFLKAFNLEEALTISTPQDLEKLKLNFLFKFFYPPMADKLKKEELFFQLSPEDLKQKIVEIAPGMKKHFETYQIQETEILPGFVRYSIPIDNEVRALGGRALTAALLTNDADDDREHSDSLTAGILDTIANIVKHGMLSAEIRNEARLPLGGASSVFTQMVWQQDVDKQKKLKEFGYHSDIRLYFSLKALNRGSYQFNIDQFGSKQGPLYSSRKNIIDFTRFFPFNIKDARMWHEVMIPYSILPEEIRAVNVTTSEMREQLLAHFKKHDIIQIDPEGKETIHGVPIDDFILVEKRISPKAVTNCNNA